jgi:hypothetical protein
VKRVILLTICSFLLFQLQAKVFFVKSGNNGNGTSWNQAFGSLHDALNRAKSGDEIWVAAGEYFTSNHSDRNASFNIPSGVKVYGGFAGTEQSVTERNINHHFTILSGEIGDPNNMYDNAFTVITLKNADQATVLSGLIIQKGSAIGSKDTAEGYGAGILNDGSNGNSSPIIEQCIFMDNVALEGAALYNKAENGVCNPIIKDCKFISNEAYLNGGAIFNNGSEGICNAQIVNCTFESNKAAYGAGIVNKAENQGRTAPIVKECEFIGNKATNRGSSVYNESPSTGGLCEAMIVGCRYEDNASSDGNVVFNRISTYDFSSLSNDNATGGSGY